MQLFLEEVCAFKVSIQYKDNKNMFYPINAICISFPNFTVTNALIFFKPFIFEELLLKFQL